MNRAKLLLFLVPLCSPQLAANVVPKGIGDVAREADWIFVAKVLSIQDNPIIYDKFGALGKTSVQFEARVKGDPFSIGGKDGVFEFLTRPDMGERAELLTGKRYVVFWRNTEAGPLLLHGHYGAREIDEANCIRTRMIGNLPTYTSLETFTKVIQLHGQGRAAPGSSSVNELIRNDRCSYIGQARP